jgi:class 3 adenylate cyclase
MPDGGEKLLCFEDLALDLRRGCLRRADREVTLRPKSFAVLRHLVEQAGRLVSKDELIGTVWADLSVTDISVARCISDVRLALRDQDRRLIKTVPRRGYLFDAPVRRAIRPDAVSDAAASQAPAEAFPGEYRHLTVMACELVGLAALPLAADLENLRAATTALQRCYTEIVERHGGHVVRRAGDDLWSYFGYPSATEHDAENAVRAALALRASAARSNVAGSNADGDPAWQACIGIASGTVMVGNAAIEGENAIGETLTLSRRLQALAQPGEIAIAESTCRLLGSLFEYREVGPTRLKGVAAPVGVALVLGESNTESRFDAYHPGGLTPMVDRAEEIDLLLRRWREAATGAGSAVLLSGEAGIGKSRIVRALFDSVGDAQPLGLHCSVLHQDSALYPWICHLQRAVALDDFNADRQRLARLESLLAKAGEHCSGCRCSRICCKFPPANATRWPWRRGNARRKR